MADLFSLPRDDKLRNTPLAEIKAELRNKKEKRWREVGPSWGIAKVSFNQLADFWWLYNEWRVNG